MEDQGVEVTIPQNDIPKVLRYSTERISDFKKFSDGVINISANAYARFKTSNDPVHSYESIEQIRQIIASGNPKQLAEVSKFFARYFSTYKRMLLYYSSFLDYKTYTTPIFADGKTPSVTKTKEKYYESLTWLDNLNIPVTFEDVTWEILSSGVYYGLIREDDDGVVLQKLPVEFCRCYSKNSKGVYLLQFNVEFFDKIMDKDMKAQALSQYPAEIRRYYSSHIKAPNSSSWVTVPAHMAAVFFYHDQIPLLISTVPALLEYEKANQRESERDQEEKEKLLVAKFPIGKQDQLIFSPTEMKSWHQALVNMLRDTPSILPITTVAEMELQQMQATSGTANRDYIEKYKNAIYDQAGVSSNLFNAEGQTSMRLSVQKDMALMMAFANIYSQWLTYQINYRFADKKVTFNTQILPITSFNREEMTKMYLSGAQYGYPADLASVAMGVSQRQLISALTMNNDILGITKKMIPVTSSFTGGNSSTGDNEVGRPQLSDTQKSEKTIANIEAGS